MKEKVDSLIEISILPELKKKQTRSIDEDRALKNALLTAKAYLEYVESYKEHNSNASSQYVNTMKDILGSHCHVSEKESVEEKTVNNMPKSVDNNSYRAWLLSQSEDHINWIRNELSRL